MAVTLDPSPEVIDNAPPGVEGFEGSEMVAAFAYNGYFGLQPSDLVNVQRADWASFEEMTQGQIHDLGPTIEATCAQNSEELLAYVFYKGVDTIIGIPEQVCILGWCFTPPFAGTQIVTANHYRLWTMTRPYPYGWAYVNPHARPLAPLLVIAIAGSIIGIIVTILGIIAMQQGKISFNDIRDTTRDILGSPGENIAKPISAAFWPLAALGISMVAAAIVFPVAISKVGVTLPLGPGRIETEIQAGGGPTAPPGRRR